MERSVLYFEKPGKVNTGACLKVVIERLSEGDINDVVVATTGGDTGLLFAEALKDRDINLVAVTHSYGFREPNTIEISSETVERLKSLGAKVYTGTMITHSLETAFTMKSGGLYLGDKKDYQKGDSFTMKSGGLYPTIIVAQSLRRFGEGPKVCCEIVMMAADAGLIQEGKEVIAVAGTGRGADTVMVIRAATSKRFLDLKVCEILAKPRG